MLTGSAVDPTGDTGSLLAAVREQRRGSTGSGQRGWRGGLLALAPGFLATAVLVALNVPRLGRKPLWLDEAYSIGATRDLVATWRGSGGTMALYYLILAPMTEVSTDRVWVRLPSLACAAAAVFVVYEIGRRLGGRATGAVAATTLALAWPITRYATEARSYTLALLLVSLGWLGLVAAIQADARGGPDATRHRRRWWCLFAVASLLAPLAHGLAALQFVTQVGLLAFLPDRWRWWRACMPIVVGLAGVGALLFGVGAGEVASWIEPLNRDQIFTLLNFLLGHGVLAWLVAGLAAVGAVAGVRAAFRPGGSGEDRLALVPLAWAIGVPLLIVAISVFRPYAVGRYVISALPGVALLVGSVVGRLRPVAFAAVAAVLVALLLLDAPETNSRYPEDWSAVAEQIAADGRDGDRLLIRDVLRAPLDYAWSELPGAGRPALVPLAPTEPVGEVRRFYAPPPAAFPTLIVADTSTPIWYVERDHTRLPAVDAVVGDPAVASRYEATGRWSFAGELYLVRLEPRPWRAVGIAAGQRLAPLAAGP